MNTPTPSPTDPMLRKTVVGRYRIVELIGDGGMCAVYRAEDREGQRPVALKVLPQQRAIDSGMAARFQREATLGKRIVHRHVVEIIDSGQLEDGALYLAMELLDGSSLAKLLEHGPLPVHRAVDIAKQMLSGLETAHTLGIVHRDIKPENVIILPAGKKDHVKLIDFGIASNDRAAIKLTVAGIAFGTPEYISPEMARGVAVDARADLYSVGVVLFEMLTGQLPFSAKDTKALLRAHVEVPPPRPRAVAPAAQLPIALENVVLRALAKLPEDRFPSAAEMRQALEGLALPAQRRSRRGWVGLGFVLALSGVIAAWWNRERSSPKPDQQVVVHQPPKSKHDSSKKPSHAK